jgi:hypothetical protein
MSTTSANKAASEEKTGLDNPLPGLYATAPETLPFAPSLEVRAYHLRRERGNLLVGRGRLRADRGSGGRAAPTRPLEGPDRWLRRRPRTLLTVALGALVAASRWSPVPPLNSLRAVRCP